MALLMVLLAVTLLSLATLAPLRNEQQLMQRERERELLFIGDQFRRAIASYAAATPVGAARLPTDLSQLLEDKRFPAVRRHLRRVYADPFTGAADWTLLKHQGAIVGVASRSTREPLKRDGFALADRAFAEAATYAGWRFMALPGAATPAATVAAPASPPTDGATDTATDTATHPANEAPQPPPPNPQQEARRQCARSHAAALNACVRDQGSSASCIRDARDVFLACLRA